MALTPESYYQILPGHTGQHSGNIFLNFGWANSKLAKNSKERETFQLNMQQHPN
jgi:hypothetical protein